MSGRTIVHASPMTGVRFARNYSHYLFPATAIGNDRLESDYSIIPYESSASTNETTMKGISKEHGLAHLDLFRRSGI